MKRLRDISLDDLAGGIRAIDLGASGGVKPEWESIAHLVNIIGFDPNAEECARLNKLPSGYKTAKFLPYALAGESGKRTLYKTKSIYCWSLLKPNFDWLARFAYADLFEPAGTEIIQVYRLDEIPELMGLDIDAMKIDTQGCELPVLTAAAPFVESSIWIETETGLVQNYEDETTFDQILHFMNLHGFGLFGIDVNHPVSRKNRLSGVSKGEQILWCEAVWLRDYYKSSPEQLKKLSRAKALRALCLHANHGCIAFGLEAAALFRDLNLISGIEYDQMARDDSWWRLPHKHLALKKMIYSTLDYMPRTYLGKFRGRLLSLISIIDEVRNTRHPLKRTGGS